MRIDYNFKKIPKRYEKNLEELKSYMVRYNIDQDLVSRFFPEITETVSIEVRHKALKQDARFYKDTIYLNFTNDIYYLWAGVCHETAHILLRKAGWEQSEVYRELKKKKLHYDVDQSCAILVQAYYESQASIRKLEWSEWQQTFVGMQVERIGKVLFDRFVSEASSKNFSMLKFITRYHKELYK